MNNFGQLRRPVWRAHGVGLRARVAALISPLLALVMVASPAQASISFGPAVNVTASGEVGDLGSGLAGAGSSLVFVYARDVDDNNFEFKDYAVRRSTDHGQTWSSAKVLVTTSADPSLWGVAGSSSTVVALFTETDQHNSRKLVLYRSANGGATWQPKLVLATPTDSSYFSTTSVAVDGNDVYVAWTEYEGTKVRLRHSANGGASFGPTKTVGTLVSGDGWPKVAASGDKVYVLWSKLCAEYAEATCVPGMKTVLLRRSLDGGATWKPVQTVTSGRWSSTTQVAASATQLLAFAETSGGFQLWRSNDSGASFHSQTISATGTYRDADAVALSGTQARLTWTDTGNGFVYIRSSSNGGATWGPNTKVTSFNAYYVDDSAVALVNGHTVVVAHCSTDTAYGWCDATS